jgi:hypothetical protein
MSVFTLLPGDYEFAFWMMYLIGWTCSAVFMVILVELTKLINRYNVD